MKFEVNTLGSLTGTWFNIYMGNNIGGIAGRGPIGGKPNPELYTWQPNLNTGGIWQTYTIPWSDFYVGNNSFAYSADGYDMSIVLQGPNSATVNYFAIDNVRVVPNK